MSEVDFSTLTHASPLLTNEKLSDALTKWFKEPFTFTHWENVGGLGKGDSYLSDLMRVRIYGKSQDGESKTIQVILKNIPKCIARRLTFRSHEFFANEINFYEKVLPELLDFQASKDVSKPFDNCVKLFLAASDGVNDVICLEDVSLQEYASAFRQEGIDVDHCRHTLEALARLHAISFAMKDQDPSRFARLSEAVFETYFHERLRGWYIRFWKRISGIAVDAVEREYPGTVYVDKIKQFCVPERYDDMIRAATQTTETGVISHGDSWTNNFLFKYWNNEPVHAKIIDFQLARCASPVLDVSFVFYACTSQELRRTHYRSLLRHYHQALADQIREMGSDPDQLYPWSLFEAELKKYSFFALAFSFESTPMIILDPEDAISMEVEGTEKLDIDDVWAIGPIGSAAGRRREADNVVHAVDHGYI